MLAYDEILPVLDDSYDKDEVALLAARGGRVDRNFRRNYAWAKHALDTGRLTKVVVVVAVNRDSWVHTVGAVTSALSGKRLHGKAAFKIDAEVRDIGGEKLTKILDALKELEPAPPVFHIGGLVAERPVRTVLPKRVDPETVESLTKPKPKAKPVEKPAESDDESAVVTPPTEQ